MKTSTNQPWIRLSFSPGASLALLLLAAPRAALAADTEPPAQPAAHLDSPLRFRNAPVVERVVDQQLLPRPSERPFLRGTYFFDNYLGDRVVRLMERSGRAGAVNALDDVPSSSWFENRIGAHDLPPQALHDRPVAPPRPPFHVVGIKEGGVTLGMRVRDANGAGYVMKFGGKQDPEGEMSADLVLQRLLWAVGYHTPEDTIIDFARGELLLDRAAKLKDARGVSRAMNAADLQRLMAQVPARADGRYRVLMSRLLDGVPVGGYPHEGVRADDPNDVVPHQDRRDVRGARVFFSWLNHVDVKEDNVLDTWMPEPGYPGWGRVRHHLVDFGNSMGMFNWTIDATAGYSQLFDAGYGARSLVSFGLWKRPWDGLQSSGLRGVGNFESARFDPAAWQPQYPWAPFERFDRFDGVWGARILMRLTPAHVAAAVAEGRYSDPRAAAYITRTLIERQHKVGRLYLAATSPLERFTVEEVGGGRARICFDDPLLAHFGAGEPALARSTRHRVATWSYAGEPVAAPFDVSGAAAQCLDGVTVAPGVGGYTVVDIQTMRAGAPRNRLLLHVARDAAGGQLRVIGLRRL